MAKFTRAEKILLKEKNRLTLNIKNKLIINDN